MVGMLSSASEGDYQQRDRLQRLPKNKQNHCATRSFSYIASSFLRLGKQNDITSAFCFINFILWFYFCLPKIENKNLWFQQFNELEKKLKEEIKLRDKAERKLKLLKKKLECFNVSTPSLQKCHSGEKCELFCGSSLCSAALLENEVRNHNVAEEHALAHTHNSPFITKDGDSLLTDTSCCNSDLGNFLPQISGKTPNQSSDNLKNGENRCSI